jgi:outer membrane protein assembly factor BamD
MTHLAPTLARAALLALALGLASCAAKGSQDSHSDFATGAMPPADQAYAVAIKQLQDEKYEHAVSDFDAIEETYPYSTWSKHAELLAGYAEYKEMDYDDAVSSLDRFISLHPADQEAAYAYYLKALCYYERIEDVDRDQTATNQAIASLDDVITRYPDSAYAQDAQVKLRLAYNRLAGHEMAIGRFYQKQHLYIAAIGRYQDVVTNYQTTTYTPEALDRLVETNLDLGLTDAALRAASVLGYNYPGSPYYEHAYELLQAHGLVTQAAQSSADSNAISAPPAPPAHHWYWPF